jgi:hypothetical protein
VPVTAAKLTSQPHGRTCQVRYWKKSGNRLFLRAWTGCRPRAGCPRKLILADDRTADRASACSADVPFPRAAAREGGKQVTAAIHSTAVELNLKPFGSWGLFAFRPRPRDACKSFHCCSFVSDLRNQLIVGHVNVHQSGWRDCRHAWRLKLRNDATHLGNRRDKGSPHFRTGLICGCQDERMRIGPQQGDQLDGLCRMALSFDRMIHPRRPTSGTQTWSGVSWEKWASIISTCSPAARRDPATVALPRHLSKKKTRPSCGGCKPELAPDAFLDVERRAAIVVC